MSQLNVLKFKEDGIYLDDQKISGITGLKLDSSTDTFTVLDLKLFVTVDNLDNLPKYAERLLHPQATNFVSPYRRRRSE